MRTRRQEQRLGSLVAAVTVTIGLLCLVNGARRVGRPFPGFLLAHNGIVVSIGRADWFEQLDARIPFSQVIGVVGGRESAAEEIQSLAETLNPGAEVTYRFRTGVEVFDATVRVRRFSMGDFLSLYGNYFLVGLVFVAASLWVLWRLGPEQTATVPFFILCQVCAMVLLTAGDVYGPYWFTSTYFAAHCIAPAALLHFASAFPDRLGGRTARVLALGAVYSVSVALALALNVVSDRPSLFLPVIYAVNLLLANAILLYLGRLVIARSGTTDARRRSSLSYAITALVLAATLPAAIFAIYPAIEGLISPLVVVAPFGLFPVLTAMALSRAPSLTATANTLVSVRLRLSFLFLAAVETGFAAGIGYFWLSHTWQQLLGDLSLFNQQQVRLERVQLADPAAPAILAQIAASAQSREVKAPSEAVLAALAAGDGAAAERSLAELNQCYRALGERLENRRQWLSRVDSGLVIGLVLVGVLQAVAFMIAVRRWLIQPIDELSAATAVIATGDLEYRSELNSSAEFASLADSINSMAASLSAIQRKVDVERTAREQASAAARDVERRRLARELHDGVLQDLSAVKLAVEGEARRASSEGLGGIAARLIEVIVGIRGVVEELRPQDLSGVSLRDAIETHVRALAQRHGVALEIDLRGAADVAAWAARDVYRITQEAVSNALRHAAPSRICVRLYTRGSEVVLEVEDDGVGFDPASVIRGGGLAGMSERSAALGARLEVRSQPGIGTTIKVEVPPARMTLGPTPS